MNNTKEIIDTEKPLLQFLPPVFNQEVAKILSLDSDDYWPWIWRNNKVMLMASLGNMKQHIDAFIDGEDIDPTTKAHHIACVAATCAIVLDAQKYNSLIDDRP